MKLKMIQYGFDTVRVSMNTYVHVQLQILYETPIKIVALCMLMKQQQTTFKEFCMSFFS